MAKLLLGSVVGPQGPQGTPGVNGSQGPRGIPGPNEVTAITDVVGLTSGQLLYNNGGKVGSVEIVDDLTSTATDKPLSANKGRVLKDYVDSAIGQIATDRGYVTVKEVADLNLAKSNGKYGIYNGLNQPIAGGHTWLVDVSCSATAPLSQIAKCVFGSAEGKIFSRYLKSDGLTWSDWKEIKLFNTNSSGEILEKISINKGGLGLAVLRNALPYNTTDGNWGSSPLRVEMYQCNSNSELPRITFHSNGAGVAPGIAGDHRRGGISAIGEDGLSLTEFNCREIRLGDGSAISGMSLSNTVPSSYLGDHRQWQVY